VSEEAAREARDIRLWLACQVYYRLTGVLFYTTLSRTIESAAIGQYFYALSLMESGLVLANLALNPWLMRSVAQKIATPLELLGGILRLRLLCFPSTLFWRFYWVDFWASFLPQSYCSRWLRCIWTIFTVHSVHSFCRSVG
jgi:hypothetical protein